MELAERMMKRAITIRPELVPPGCGIEALRVIRHQVGLRPVREGGPRVEIEKMHDPALGKKGAMPVIHCYGSGSFGFQASYGMASKAAMLVSMSLAKNSGEL